MAPTKFLFLLVFLRKGGFSVRKDNFAKEKHGFSLHKSRILNQLDLIRKSKKQGTPKHKKHNLLRNYGGARKVFFGFLQEKHCCFSDKNHFSKEQDDFSNATQFAPRKEVVFGVRELEKTFF